MSRIGKQPVEIPDGVEVKIEGNEISAKGPLGFRSITIRPEILMKQEDNKIILEKKNDERQTRALYGLSRTLVSNLIVGVKSGFDKKLEINGVGYRAAVEGNNLNLQLGYSHPVKVVAPEGIKFVMEGNTKITVSGIDKQLVGDVSAEIRSKRPPEVYKGKGVKFAGEHIRRKAGKTGKK